MSVAFKWTGLRELYDDFATLAQDLAAAAAPDVESAADRAATTIRSGYPSRTGNLRDHVTTTLQQRGDTVVRAVIENTSPHAVLFERGSQARHTALGANRGSMPPNPLFSSTIVRARAALYAQPIPDVLVRFGLKVFGRGA